MTAQNFKFTKEGFRMRPITAQCRVADLQLQARGSQLVNTPLHKFMGHEAVVVGRRYLWQVR